MCYGDSFLLCLAKMTLFLIVAGHQDRIVNGCSQLDSSDYDTCYERKGYSLIIRDCHIYKNRKMNGREIDLNTNRMIKKIAAIERIFTL